MRAPITNAADERWEGGLRRLGWRLLRSLNAIFVIDFVVWCATSAHPPTSGCLCIFNISYVRIYCRVQAASSMCFFGRSRLRVCRAIFLCAHTVFRLFLRIQPFQFMTFRIPRLYDGPAERMRALEIRQLANGRKMLSDDSGYADKSSLNHCYQNRHSNMGLCPGSASASSTSRANSQARVHAVADTRINMYCVRGAGRLLPVARLNRTRIGAATNAMQRGTQEKQLEHWRR